MEKKQDLDKLVQQYLQAIRSAGFRMTNQRKIIIETLLKNMGDHPNAQELLEMAQMRDPSIGIATVYRTVELLNNMDLLNLTSLQEGFRRYEIADDNLHLHFYCRCCGSVYHTSADKEKENRIQQWAREAGFKIMPQVLEIYGICEKCQAEMAEMPEEDYFFRCTPRCGRFGRRTDQDQGRGRRRWCRNN